MTSNLKLGILARLESKPGKEAEVENFLREGLTLAQAETETIVWFALRLSQTTFGIFDAFENEAGRKGHLTGKIAEALFAKAPELFSQPPTIEQVDVLAAKI
jgi:quinol monooxygenase YgiN